MRLDSCCSSLPLPVLQRLTLGCFPINGSGLIGAAGIYVEMFRVDRHVYLVVYRGGYSDQRSVSQYDVSQCC